MADDLTLKFGVDIGSLSDGAQAAAGEIEGLQAPVQALTAKFREFGEAAHAHITLVSSDMEHFHTRIRDTMNIFSTFGEVFIAGLGVECLGESLNRVLELGDELEKLSQKTGISVENLSRLRFAAGYLDINFEAVQNGARKLAVSMQEALSQPTGQAARAFQAAGISAQFLRDHSNDLYAVLLKLAEAHKASSDGARRRPRKPGIHRPHRDRAHNGDWLRSNIARTTQHASATLSARDYAKCVRHARDGRRQRKR